MLINIIIVLGVGGCMIILYVMMNRFINRIFYVNNMKRKVVKKGNTNRIWHNKLLH